MLFEVMAILNAGIKKVYAVLLKYDIQTLPYISCCLIVFMFQYKWKSSYKKTQI